MVKANRTLEKPERIIVFELPDVITRRQSDKPNIFVTTTSHAVKDNAKVLVSLQKSRRRLGSKVLKVRNDLCPDGWFKDSKARGAAKAELCKELATQGYCVNPNPDSKYSIYVVKLARTAWLKDERQPVYVGESSYEPVERIAQHLQGVRAARKVKNHFESRWEALEPQGKLLHSPYDAIAEETLWGMKLLGDGYKVFGPQGLPQEKK